MLSLKRENIYESNIWKFYAINFFVGLRFIVPIHLLYYLSFNLSYSQIGLIELSAAVTILILEVPTGIFADLLGRKRSMIIGYILSTFSFLIMSLGSNLEIFIFAWILSGAADAFESGTNDALLFDTLKKINRENEYIKIKSRFIFIFTFSVIIGSLLGSYFYLINRRLPWILYTSCIGISGIFYLLMKEPCFIENNPTKSKSVDKFKTSLIASLKNKKVIFLVILSIFLAIPMFSFTTLMSQPYLISKGFNILSLGFIFALINGFSGFISSLSYKIEERLGEKRSFFIVVLLFTLILICMGIFKDKIALFFVIAFFTIDKYKRVIIDNYLNQQIDSSTRATVLSIQSFMNNIVVTTLIVFIGHMADLYSINVVLIFMGIGIGLITSTFLIIKYLQNNESNF